MVAVPPQRGRAPPAGAAHRPNTSRWPLARSVGRCGIAHRTQPLAAPTDVDGHGRQRPQGALEGVHVASGPGGQGADEHHALERPGEPGEAEPLGAGFLDRLQDRKSAQRAEVMSARLCNQQPTPRNGASADLGDRRCRILTSTASVPHSACVLPRPPRAAGCWGSSRAWVALAGRQRMADKQAPAASLAYQQPCQPR